MLTTFLAVVAFALGHQITYVVEYGTNAGQVLARSGHDGQWTLSVVSVLGLALLLVAIAARQLVRLSREASGLTGSAVRRSALVGVATDTLGLALLVLVISLAAFVVSENVEYIAAGLDSPGLTLLLSPQHQATLVIFEFVSVAVAFVAALYLQRRDGLVELIELARRLARRDCCATSRRNVQTLAANAIVRGTPPGRAPPLPA